MSTVMVTGMRMPAPEACTRRPARSTGKFGPRAARSVPAANSNIEDTNSFRVENRSCKNAVIGIMMAFTRVNPVVSHWAVDWSTDISSMMEGSAGVTRVWFNTVTKAPNTNTASIIHCLRVSFICYLVCFSSSCVLLANVSCGGI